MSGAAEAAVLVYMKGPIGSGGLANSIFSFGGTSGLGGSSYTTFLTPPFFNYNLGEGWHYRIQLAVTGQQSQDGADRHAGWAGDQDRPQTDGQPGDRCPL
jgi:hypothetical protein